MLEELNATVSDNTQPEISVIIVSYNTRDLTLRALATLYETSTNLKLETLVWDNASHDGSGAAIQKSFPAVTLIENSENIGFAAANNEAAKHAKGKWLLLLNPDTEVHPNAVANLLALAKNNPSGGLYGGRTVFPDGSLNEYSCLFRMTPWSVFCRAFFLERIFRRIPFFDREVRYYWKRDDQRSVDIIVGCWLLVSSKLWNQLRGFNTKYWMYGEDVDLSLRAGAMGFKPLFSPDAVITHIVGASSSTVARKIILRTQARITLICDHWPQRWHWWGILMEQAWAFNRWLLSGVMATLFKGEKRSEFESWNAVWNARQKWSKPYQIEIATASTDGLK